MWAVGYYHHDATGNNDGGGGASGGGYRYRIWGGGEDVFGKLFWSEGEGGGMGKEDDDDNNENNNTALVVMAAAAEVEEEKEDDGVQTETNTTNDEGCGGMMMMGGMAGNDGDGDLGYVTSCFGTVNMQQQRQKREVKREGSVVTVVKLNEEEDEEKDIVENIGERSTSALDEDIDTTARQRRRLQSVGRELGRFGIRRIRSAPAKGGRSGSPSDRRTTTATWTAPFREHHQVDDRTISTMGQSLSMEERPNIGCDRSMTTMRRSSRVKDATTTMLVDVAGGNAKSSPPSSGPTSPPTTDGPLAIAAKDKTIIERDDRRKDVIDRHFPPLEICVVRSVELVGLNSAAQFFDVFFADDAPYSMRDFQQKRGDVDVVYGLWEDCPVHDRGSTPGERDKEDAGGCGTALYSVKEGGGVEPLPPNSTRQRTMRFNTLTKSYFGPAYATATKIQRATLLADDRVLVIENVTHLSEIPYADRFRVIERWVLEVAAEGEGGSDAAVAQMGYDNDMKPRLLERSRSAGGELTSSATEGGRGPRAASCRLTIHAEVQMLKPCSWETQIRKKASETFTEVAMDWCKSATVALSATEEHMRRRLRIGPPGDGDDRNIVFSGDDGTSGSGLPPLSSSMQSPKPAASSTTTAKATDTSTATTHSSVDRGRSDLLAVHKRNFDQLEKRIANGDLELCSIEVMHSSQRPHGNNEDFVITGSITSPLIFTTVLEYPSLNEYEISYPVTEGSARASDNEIKMVGFAPQRKKAAVMIKSKSSKLFKRLRSRSRSTNGKSANEKQQQPSDR
ncbi:hypothetical protein ACHAXA_010713 [Cyclostephanos tholiformis]|uniref:VASt domain-containing protein n=1 Tax=Cyclostephanos tholiformis TaxID=382380 RepID=A0ABD3RAA3_9STRA